MHAKRSLIFTPQNEKHTYFKDNYMRDKIFLIGPMDMGNIPTNGVTMKNQLFYKRFNELFDTVKYIDTWNISQKPGRIVKILSALLYHKDYKFIVS